MGFSTMLATVFMIINIAKPELHDHTLMPALQSPWFVPHVSVYMFSYALLGCATLLSVYGLWRPSAELDKAINRVMSSGIAFFTIGMLSGALWAKEAWGTYWNWDPKEAWAAATWLLYLLAIHLAMNLNSQTKQRLFRAIVIIAFLGLQMCWYGVNYLPSAAQSIHTYNQQ
jgi:ABC-type transport system involved in cytochrome c biogenesis permease subunit